MNYIFVALLALNYSLSAHAAFDPSLLCTLVVNGTKLNDPRACNSWIECINGEQISGTCNGDLFYDRASEECVPSENVECISSNPCAATAGINGFVADPYSCNGYYYCAAGSAARGQCGSGMNFNPGTQDCIRNYPCVPKMDPDSYCNIVPDGIFIKNTANCNGWQMCWDAVVINGTCPGTFYFNAKNGNCDYPKNVDCVDSSIETPLIDKDGVCPKAGAFVADNSTCNGYYYCHELQSGEIVLEHGTCNDTRLFSPANGGACITRTQVYCNYDRCAGLGLTSIQLANESADDCTGYAVCQDGITIGKGSCPSGKYFDVVSQRCTTQVISYPSCMLSTATTSVSPSTSIQVNDDE